MISNSELEFLKASRYSPHQKLVPTLSELVTVYNVNLSKTPLEEIDALIRAIVGNKLIQQGIPPNPKFKHLNNCQRCGPILLEWPNTSPTISCPWCQCPKDLLPKI